MDAHDQELLDKQLRGIYQPPQPAGMIAMAIVAIFLVGMIAGNVLTDASSSPTTASGPAMALLDTGAPVTRN